MALKLYGFYPDGHGQYSFFVCAESEQEAREAVDAAIPRIRDSEYSNYSVQGWGSDYYSVVEVEPGHVIFNAND